MARDPRLSLPKGTELRITRRRVIIAFAPLLSHPKPRAAQQTELVHGQEFDVHAEQGRWAFGRVRPLVRGSRRSGYVGWFSRVALGDVQSRSTHFVNAISAPVFCQADL